MTKENATGKGTFAMPPVLYDILKDTALIYLPATGTLYFTIAQIWGLLYAEEIVGTVVAVSTFLGVCLKISNVSYHRSEKSNDGILVVDQSDPSKDKYLLDITTDLNDVAASDRIVLKVDNQTKTPPASSMDPRNVKRSTSQN